MTAMGPINAKIVPSSDSIQQLYKEKNNFTNKLKCGKLASARSTETMSNGKTEMHNENIRS